MITPCCGCAASHQRDIRHLLYRFHGRTNILNHAGADLLSQRSHHSRHGRDGRDCHEARLRAPCCTAAITPGDFFLPACYGVLLWAGWQAIPAFSETDREVAVLRVGLFLPANFSVLSFAPVAAFETANFVARERFYDLRLVSESGERIANSLGGTVDTEPMGERPYDTLLVGAASEVVPATPTTLAFLREAAASARRIASICLGAFSLAEAGLLDGRRATTHWARAQELQQRFPKIRVEMDRIFIADGPVWTSAGMAAGIDLALGLIERDMGQDVAQATARTMVVYHRRAGGQSQHSAMLELDAKSDRVQMALAYARQNLREPLTLGKLAEAACLSPRQFTRVFRAETGQSPAKAIENLRLEAARFMLEQGRLSVEEIARASGFGDRERMRRSFLRSFGQTPQSIRNASHPLVTI
jgi:transcriptional regulator GlxA family with amidase domain